MFDSTKGEVKSIYSVDKESIVLSSPLNFSFLKEETSVFLLREVFLFLDKNKHTLRRKVNTSPAQPLLEEVGLFDFHRAEELIESGYHAGERILREIHEDLERAPSMARPTVVHMN